MTRQLRQPWFVRNLHTNPVLAARLKSEADMNRVVLVTGACGGIGSVLCRRFVEQGDTVLALDIDAAALKALTAQLGEAHVTPIAVDLGDAAAVQQAVAAAVKVRAPVDVLVANAGAAQGLTLATTDVASWQRDIHLNLNG